MLRYLISGESHGRGLVAILEGMPAGLKVEQKSVDLELKRRQSGFGRGKRMLIERDLAQIISGLRKKITLGSPITLLIINKDFKIEKLPGVFSPRPGHADLPGLLKYGFSDVRDVLERASARSTAATVALGAICKIFLSQFDIKISSRVISVAGENTKEGMINKISLAIKNKDTVGGIFEVKVKGLPAGLGSYVQPDRRLDSLIAGGIMAIPGIKAVEIGLGLGYAYKTGSQVHDEIFYSEGKGYHRLTNNAGGIEGGISNGEDLILRACMKPISTLINPLNSVNIVSKKSQPASVVRTDTCVVEAAGVVGESVIAFELARAFMDKFGCDCMADIKNNYRGYLKRIG